MICPKCGTNAADGDNYCEECGASLKNKDRRETFKPDVDIADSYLAFASHPGMKHPKNEDMGAVTRRSDGGVILVVADGVTSALNSVSASTHAVNKVKEVLAEVNTACGADLIRNAIIQANDAILKLPYENREDGILGPETTIVTAVVLGDTVLIGWVGDSRAYIIDKISQKVLTTDDSWIELMVAAGVMTRDKAFSDKRAHYVTQVLGMHGQDMEVHTLQTGLKKGQMLLLCTDGLWNYMQGDEDLLKAITDYGIDKDAADICMYLINLANAAGGHDNITAAIYKNF